MPGTQQRHEDGRAISCGFAESSLNPSTAMFRFLVVLPARHLCPAFAFMDEIMAIYVSGVHYEENYHIFGCYDSIVVCQYLSS
jgi:hypothetical protein